MSDLTALATETCRWRHDHGGRPVPCTQARREAEAVLTALAVEGWQLTPLPPPDVMEWLRETYKPKGVEIWVDAWRKATPERREFLERLAHMDGMGT